MRAVGLAALIGGIALAMTTPVSSQTPLSQADALAPFFERLEQSDARRVHILQIGDSHTAGDLITSSLRSRLQARFGRGGRGVLPPGRPYPGYQPRQVEVTEAGWSSTTPPPGQAGWPAAGLSGTRALVGGAGGRFEIVAEPSARFTRAVVCGRGPGGVMVEIDAAARAMTFDGPEACAAIDLESPAERLTVTPGNGSVELYSVATFAETGVALSNLGVIGATMVDLARRDEAVVWAEMTAWTPDLIVLAFGTNEGFDPLLDIGAYETLLRGQIDRLRRLAPDVAILMLGAPDALSPNGGPMCDAAPPGQTRWSAPVMLGLVRDVQGRVAADTGVAFWDWRMAMGGDCSADRLATAAEPLMRGDRVHFNSAGGDWIGRLIFDDLMAAHADWMAGAR